MTVSIRAAHAVAAGGDAMWLTVIKANAQARRFYSGIGGVEGAPMQELLYRQPVATYPVRWSGAALHQLARGALLQGD